MKTWKSFILIGIALLLNSCIIKSLQPFYTTESLSFNKELIGSWIDNEKGKWTVESIKTKMEEDQTEGIKLSKEDLTLYETYKDGYFITFIEKDKEAGFIAMPFKINQHYFLDFIPVEIQDDEINSLAAEHLLKTHSVAKLHINSDKEVSFSWLSEERLQDLFNAQKIRLKHEKIGFQDDLLLTASSKELYAFLKKYTEANLFKKYEEKENKWKSNDKLTLTKADAKP